MKNKKNDNNDNLDRTNYSIIFFTAKEMEKKFPILINQNNWKEIYRIAFSLTNISWNGACYEFYVEKATEAIKKHSQEQTMGLVEMLKIFVKKAMSSEDEKFFFMQNSWNAIK